MQQVLRSPLLLSRVCSSNAIIVKHKSRPALVRQRQEDLGLLHSSTKLPSCKFSGHGGGPASPLPAARTAAIRCYSSSPSVSPHPSTSPYISPVIDIAEYFLNGSDRRRAPKIPDFTGPVRVGRTPDGRGRGLYLTQDVTAGDVLIVSNAFAATYNDSEKTDMCQKIISMVKDSPRALRQFYALAGTDYQSQMDVPDVKLFDTSIPYTDTSLTLEIDEDRIRHIVQVNSFSGKLTSANEPEAKFNGLWLLPSFMNHSCSPTASRNMVGEVMVFMAGQDMKANEELTICYTDCLVPLQKRDDVLRRTGYGFLCQCQRCVLERSVHEQLEEISDRYHALYDKAAEEVYSVATKREKGSFSASKELRSIYDKLTKKVASLDGLTKLQKQWILGGYSSAFLADFLTTGYTTDFANPATLVTPSAIELVKAMMATVPGMQRTLSFSVMLATVAPNRDDQIALVELAMLECARLYGKQRPEILKKLALQAVELVPFF